MRKALPTRDMYCATNCCHIVMLDLELLDPSCSGCSHFITHHSFESPPQKCVPNVRGLQQIAPHIPYYIWFSFNCWWTIWLSSDSSVIREFCKEQFYCVIHRLVNIQSIISGCRFPAPPQPVSAAPLIPIKHWSKHVGFAQSFNTELHISLFACPTNPPPPPPLPPSASLPVCLCCFGDFLYLTWPKAHF